MSLFQTSPVLSFCVDFRLGKMVSPSVVWNVNKKKYLQTNKSKQNKTKQHKAKQTRTKIMSRWILSRMVNRTVSNQVYLLFDKLGELHIFTLVIVLMCFIFCEWDFMSAFWCLMWADVVGFMFLFYCLNAIISCLSVDVSASLVFHYCL